jgi:hypothetical protein
MVGTKASICDKCSATSVRRLRITLSAPGQYWQPIQVFGLRRLRVLRAQLRQLLGRVHHYVTSQ